MIRVKKGPKPEILKKNASTWTKKYCNAIKNGKKAKANYNKKPIKKAVIEESHDKCVFCESKVSHVYHGDIEHFRPKSKFCKYTHTWSNLLFSCRICNSKKSNTFPTENQIIKPTEENPEKFFEYDALPNGKLVSLVPLNERAKNSIEIMGLNRDELRARRGERWHDLESMIEVLRTHGISENIISDHFKSYKDDSREFTGMFRYFF